MDGQGLTSGTCPPVIAASASASSVGAVAEDLHRLIGSAALGEGVVGVEQPDPGCAVGCVHANRRGKPTRRGDPGLGFDREVCLETVLSALRGLVGVAGLGGPQC